MNRVSIFMLLRPMVRPTIRRMQVREAKDFLVQETAKQASIEGEALSELEKRMMYFTESGYVPEDPIALSEVFEATYDSDEYEAKIAKLLDHAYQRARKENEETQRRFDSAIKCLRRGDHYMLVMRDMRPVSDLGDVFRPNLPTLIGIGIAIFVFAGFYAIRSFARHFTPPNPRVIQVILGALILFGLLFQRVVAKAFGWILENTVKRFMGGNKGED
jgi:hypothetical protein